MQPFDKTIADGIHRCAKEVLAAHVDEAATHALALDMLLAFFGPAWEDVCFWLRTKNNIKQPKAHLIQSVLDRALELSMSGKT